MIAVRDVETRDFPNFVDKWIIKDRKLKLRSISVSGNFLILWDTVKL